MKKLLAVVVALTLVSAMFVGCGAKEDKTIKFGMLGAQSGEIAIYGLGVKNGEQLAIDEINEAGGVLGKQVELFAYDTEGDPTKAISLFNKLVDEDGIHALIGPTFSGESMTVGPLANEKKIVMLSPTATNADVTPGLDYVYRTCFSDPYQGKVAAKFASDILGADKVVIFRNVGVDYSVGLADNFIEAYTGEIVADEGYTNEDQDFKAIIAKIADLEPAAIFIPDYSQMVGLISTQIRDAGIDVPLIGADGWDGVQADYGDVMEGSFFTNHYAADDDAEAIQSFIAKYEEKYGETPNALAALGYDSAKIMAAAIEAAGSTDSEKILAELAKTSYEGVTGLTEFDANGDTSAKQAVIIKITNGGLVFETKMSE